MIKTGLVSITFRNLSPEEIVTLVSEAGLDAVEWGGDVHVPHGDVDAARTVRALTESAGLQVSSYGSYYRAAESEQEGLSFESVLDSAVTLGAPIVRIWAGKKNPDDADDAYRAAVVEDTRRVANMAESAGLRVGLEYHGGTLTQTNESAQAFLRAVDHPAVEPYWQPPNARPVEENLGGLQAIASDVSVVHVFHWVYDSGERDMRPLAEGEDAWSQYFHAIQNAPRERSALLEFVRGGTPEQFKEDAATLRRWLGC